MKLSKISALALSLALCLCLPSKAQVINQTMGDDGYANVPLQFSFPFYGQRFNNSWMYDNGVVSFIDPSQPGALSPWAWSATPLSQAPGNYFIAPLWADLAPVPGTTTYTTQGTTQYQRYNWNNIAEYYSIGSGTGLRLNSFSLEIKPDGTFTSTYSAVNLSTSNISVGSVGNVSAGEYNQVYYAPNGTQVTSIPNWSSSTYLPPQVDPCSTNPQSSPSCPGYIAPITENPVVQQITKQSTIVDSTQTNFTITDVGGVTIDSSGQIAAPLAVPETTKDSIKLSTSTNDTTEKETRIRPRVAIIIRDAIENRIAMAIVRESIGISMESSGALSTDVGTGIIVNRIISFGEEEKKETIKKDDKQNYKMMEEDFRTENTKTTTTTNNISPNTSLQQTLSIQEDKPSNKSSVRNGGNVDGLPNGISIASLSSGVSLNSYSSIQLKDTQFYAPKEIYKGQQTVDNRNASRRLFGANDARHAEMVNQQYQIGN